MTKTTTTMIGGDVCNAPLAEEMLPADPRELTNTEVDRLWQIFVAIGDSWENIVHDSAGLKSSWLEFVTQKATIRPSYVAEFVNAIEVVAELIEKYDEDSAFNRLFFENGIPGGALTTRLAHAKHFVVDEFIQVQIVAGGFKKFIEPHPPKERPVHISNHRAFIAGSRFNRNLPVRPYKGPANDES